jgi:hypothetical protein
MKQSNYPLNLDFSEIISNVKPIKETQFEKFDFFLGYIANEVYPTYYYLINDIPFDLKPMHKDRAAKTLTDLERIKEQSTTLMNILRKMNFKSKNMKITDDMLNVIQLESENYLVYLKNKKLSKK